MGRREMEAGVGMRGKEIELTYSKRTGERERHKVGKIEEERWGERCGCH